MIVPLPGGQSATLRERLLYQQGRDLRAAFIEVNKDQTAFADLSMALVRAYVESWNVLDLNGNAVPLDKPEGAPWDVIEEIGVKAMGLWQAGEGVPKAGNGTSPTSLPVHRSRVRTRT